MLTQAEVIHLGKIALSFKISYNTQMHSRERRERRSNERERSKERKGQGTGNPLWGKGSLRFVLPVLAALTVGYGVLAQYTDLPFPFKNKTAITAEDPLFLNTPQEIFTEKSANYYLFAKIPEKATPVDSATDQINPTYLRDLFDKLQQPTDSVTNKATVVADNLSLLELRESLTSDIINGAGSAIKIDEGGIYLTVSHLLQERYVGAPITSPVVVHTPRSSEGFQANSYIIDQGLDLGVIYAPTGRPFKPVEGMQIRTDLQKPGERVWILGLLASKTFTWAGLGILSGNYSPQVPLPYNSARGAQFMAGIQPFGSSSGGPVIDSEGRLIGIESGAVAPQGQNQRSDYEGAIVAPIKGISQLLTKPIHLVEAKRNKD